MGFWSRLPSKAKTNTNPPQVHKKIIKHINQRICPLVEQQQQVEQEQSQQLCHQHPPKHTPKQLIQREKQTFVRGNSLSNKKHDRYHQTAAICHRKNRERQQEKQQKQEQPRLEQYLEHEQMQKHKEQQQYKRLKMHNFHHTNKVNGLLFQPIFPPTLKSATTSKGNRFRKFHNIVGTLNRMWMYCYVPLFFLLPSLTTTAETSTTTTTAAFATAMYTQSALVTFVTTTIASVSGAAAPYANGALIYDKKSHRISTNEAEDISENIEGEPGEELMYAYYKRAQRHKQQQQQQQQQHQKQHKQQQQRHHQHASSVPAEIFQELDSDEIIPTLDIISVLAPKREFVARTQKRSEKLTPNTSKSSTPAPLTLTTSTPSPSAKASPSSSSSSTTSSTAVPPNSSRSKTTTTTTTSTTSSPEEELCEPKVLDEVPAEPFYDFSDVAEDAARQFSEFLGNKFTDSPPPTRHNMTDEVRQEITRRAYSIASYALNEDDSLLAFAIAAPSVHTVVLKFKSNVTVPPEQAQNRSFLGSYWRELTYAWNSTEEQEWGAPFRDCNLLKKRWLWPFRISYTENKFKIVAAAFIAADEDICNDGLEEIFGRRHGCDRNTTFCLVTENKPMPARDAYTCICRESFYLPNSTLQGFRGDIVEMSEGYDNYSCIPCPDGCTLCDQNGNCLLLGEPPEVVSLESLMKVSVGSVLGACILCCLVLSVIVFRQRKSKAIAIGMWTVLETILLGIILLYASVTVHFFPASTIRCLIEPWLRELGFVIFYGAIILKLYRHLVDFRTRKAHRWVLRDVDLLKYLATMVFAVICYLAGFTASSYDLLNTGHLETLRETSTNTCIPLKWEYVTQTSEIFILCFGLHLSLASRNANTQFRERQFLVAVLMLEFVVSTTFYVLRFTYLPEMSPSTIFLALFARSQLTNTISLGLIFVPKLWYQHKQVRSLAHDLSIRLPVDAFKGSHDVGQRLGGGYAGLCLGDPDIGELTISEMSPEDIRAELKRLYTQLEILKNKTLRQDNPHISKRRGGRKAGHRRFSLQALSAKHRSHKHHQDVEITEAEPSRTPEDSVCSVEGPTDAEISGISQSMLSHSVVSQSVVSQSK